MKSVIKIFLCFFLLSYSIYILAQDSTKHCFVNGIGIKSGITISQLVMKNSPMEAANGKTGYLYSPNFALTAEFLHHKNFRLATDIRFIQKGGKIDEQHPYYKWVYSNGSSEVKTKLSFLSWNIVPMAMLNINKFSPYIFVGPRMDYFHYSSSEDPIYNSNNRRLHFGITSGMGVNYRINKKNMLLLEAIKYFNFIPYYESYTPDPPCAFCYIGYERTLGKLNDRTIVINVGYKYLLNHK